MQPGMGGTRLAWTLLAGLLPLFPSVAAADELDRRYEIEAAYTEDTRVIEGVTRIRLRNQGPIPLSNIFLILYPNLYAAPNPQAKAAATRAYPAGFSPGRIEILGATGSGGEPLAVGPGEASTLQREILARVTLAAPLVPGGSETIEVRFRTQIPEKFGIFGYWEGVATLEGGWHPYVPAYSGDHWQFEDLPPPATYLLRLEVDRDVAVIHGGELEGRPEEQGERKRVTIRSSELPLLTLILTRSFALTQRTDRNHVLSLWHHAKDHRYALRSIDALIRALAFFDLVYGLPPGREIVFAQSALYQDVATPAFGVGLTARRLFRVLPALRSYHERSLARALFYLLWKRKVPWEEEWVVEALAEHATLQYSQTVLARRFSIQDLLRPLAFLPPVDQVLYSEALPLRQVYFGKAVHPIPREDIRLFNDRRAHGSTVMAKLGSLIGNEDVSRIVLRYLGKVKIGERPEFRSLTKQLTGQDLEWFYHQWLDVNPQSDFELKRVRERRVRGIPSAELRIVRHGDAIEPLEVRIIPRKGKPTSFRWLSTEPQLDKIVPTPSGVRAVELDPEEETSDPFRLNNRRPARWKILLEDISLRYDFQSKNVGYSTGVYLQRVYDDNHAFRLSYANGEELRGAETSYTRVFRNALFPAVQQSLTTALAWSKVPIPPPSRNTTLKLRYTFGGIGFPAYSEYIQQLIFGKFPHSAFSADYAQNIAGDEGRAWAIRARVDLRKDLAFATYHTLSLRFLHGESFGTFDTERRYYLGGASALRGYTTLAAFGEHINLGMVEYRYPLVYDLSRNVGGIALTHAIQAAVFFDTGSVSTHRTPFRFQDYVSDVGVGLRFFFDAFGLYPVIGRFDAAFPIHPPIPDEDEVHYYVSAGQPF